MSLYECKICSRNSILERCFSCNNERYSECKDCSFCRIQKHSSLMSNVNRIISETVLNPETGRYIKRGGLMFKELQKRGIVFD